MEIEQPFPKEEIPNESALYYRVINQNVRNGEVLPGAFKASIEDQGMSTNWDEYSKPEDLLNGKDERFGVIKLSVKTIRLNENLAVKHNPVFNNRSHTLVFGIPLKKGDLQTSVRYYLSQNYEWSIKIAQL